MTGMLTASTKTLHNIGTAMEVEKNIDVDVVFLYFLKLASH